MPDIHINRYKPINHEALMIEFEAVLPGICLGFSTGGYGVIAHCVDNITSDQAEALMAIVLAHDETILTPAQQAALDQAAVVEGAHTQALNIPNWATWDEAAVLTWINAHTSATQVDAITNLATAKTVIADMCIQLRALSRMVVALRNKSWPDLQG
jgi:hypothetical protein